MDFDAHNPTWFFNEENLDAARADLSAYFDRYPGAYFDRLARRDQPNRITADDIVAVSTLGVGIPSGKVAWLLGDGADAVSKLLEQIPADATIWDESGDLSEGGPAWQLWDLLKSRDSNWPRGWKGTGRTRVSKLLAAKRPNLVPIQDSQVDWALFGARIPNYWEPWQRLHRSTKGAALRQTALQMRDGAGISDEVGPLRVIDIVIWMWSEHNHRSSDPAALS